MALIGKSLFFFCSISKHQVGTIFGLPFVGLGEYLLLRLFQECEIYLFEKYAYGVTLYIAVNPQNFHLPSMK